MAQEIIRHRDISRGGRPSDGLAVRPATCRVELLVTPNALTVSNNNIVMSGNTMTNNPVAVAIGGFPANAGTAVYIQGVPRYLGKWSRAGAWRAQNMS